MQRIIIRDRYIPITRTRTVSATVLTGNETTLAEGWYVVADDIKYTSTVFASGDINLILCDGKKMSIATTNANGFKSENNSLTIYGQNADSGILDVRNNNSTNDIHAIYVKKDITINGGQVTAKATKDGSVTLYAQWLIPTLEGDANGDGQVNVTDIMGIANIILKVDATAASRAVRKEEDTVEPQ